VKRQIEWMRVLGHQHVRAERGDFIADGVHDDAARAQLAVRADVHRTAHGFAGPIRGVGNV